MFSDFNHSLISSGWAQTPASRTNHAPQCTNKPSMSWYLHFLTSDRLRWIHKPLYYSPKLKSWELAVCSFFCNVTVNGSQWAHSSPNSWQRNLLNNAYGGLLVIFYCSRAWINEQSIAKPTNDQSPSARVVCIWRIRVSRSCWDLLTVSVRSKLGS